MTPEEQDFRRRLSEALGPKIMSLRGPLPEMYRPRFVRGLNVASQALARGDMDLVRDMRAELDRIIDHARPEIDRAFAKGLS